MNLHNYFSVVLRRDPSDGRRLLLLDGVGAPDIVGTGFPWAQRLNTFSRVRTGDEARIYDEQHMLLQQSAAVSAVEESHEVADRLLANHTLLQMGFQTNTRAWVGEVRCYWVTFAVAVPPAVQPRAYVNIDRLSGSGAIVRGNTFNDCGTLRFKSIGGVIESCMFNHTKGLYITIQPQWLEGSVGLRDVVVAGNSFIGTRDGAANVTVGRGTRNISVNGVVVTPP